MSEAWGAFSPPLIAAASLEQRAAGPWQPGGAGNITCLLSVAGWCNEGVQCQRGLGAGSLFLHLCFIFSTFYNPSAFSSAIQRAFKRPGGMTKVNTSANIYIYDISTSWQTSFWQDFMKVNVQQRKELNNFRNTRFLFLSVGYCYPPYLPK